MTSWTVAHQAPLSVGFSRQEYCSGLPFHFPGDLPEPGIEPASLVSPASAGTTNAALPLCPQGTPVSGIVEEKMQWKEMKGSGIWNVDRSEGSFQF